MAPLDVIAEPVGRNTAPAIGLAATLIAARDPQAVMAVLPADHFIRDEAGLRDCLQTAAQTARNGYLVTLGIVPTRPETGYGYIEADMALRGAGPVSGAAFCGKTAAGTGLALPGGPEFSVEQRHIRLAGRCDPGRDCSARCRSWRLSWIRCSFGGDVWDVADLEPQIEAFTPAWVRSPLTTV